jgi:hypothetical protein
MTLAGVFRHAHADAVRQEFSCHKSSCRAKVRGVLKTQEPYTPAREDALSKRVVLPSRTGRVYLKDLSRVRDGGRP